MSFHRLLLSQEGNFLPAKQIFRTPVVTKAVGCFDFGDWRCNRLTLLSTRHRSAQVGLTLFFIKRFIISILTINYLKLC